QPALVLADAELPGLLRRHEVEHASAAYGPDDGGGPAGILDGNFGLTGLGFAGVMKELAGAVRAAGDAAEPLLEEEIHVAVVVVGERVERDQGVEHEDVDLLCPDFRLELVERRAAEDGSVSVVEGGEPQRLVADRLDEQPAAAVSLGDAVALADSGEPP